MAARKRATKVRTKTTPLAKLRKELRALTQVQVAEKSGVYQADVSKLELRPTLDDVVVSTLRRYVEALGGELRLVAKIGKKTYELRGAKD